MLDPDFGDEEPVLLFGWLLVELVAEGLIAADHRVERHKIARRRECRDAPVVPNLNTIVLAAWMEWKQFQVDLWIVGQF